MSLPCWRKRLCENLLPTWEAYERCFGAARRIYAAVWRLHLGARSSGWRQMRRIRACEGFLGACRRIYAEFWSAAKPATGALELVAANTLSFGARRSLRQVPWSWSPHIRCSVVSAPWRQVVANVSRWGAAEGDLELIAPALCAARCILPRSRRSPRRESGKLA